MFLVNPYNFRVVHRVLDPQNRNRTLDVGRQPTGPKPTITAVLNKSGVDPTTVEGSGFVGNPISDNEILFTHTSGTATVTLTKAQILAASGVYNDGIVIVPESLLPDVDMETVTVVANEHDVVFVII